MIEEKIKLSRDTYENVKAMLESSDKSNMKLGFECLENIDFKENLVYILMLLQECNLDWREWLEHSPDTYKYLDKSLKLDMKKPFGFRDVGRLALTYSNSEEDFQFVMDKYSQHLVKLFNKIAGKELVNEVTIKIKLNA